jgi:hypothetical protein
VIGEQVSGMGLSAAFCSLAEGSLKTE